MCCCSQSAVSFLKTFPSDFGFAIHPSRLCEARVKELAAIWLDHHCSRSTATLHDGHVKHAGLRATDPAFFGDGVRKSCSRRRCPAAHRTALPTLTMAASFQRGRKKTDPWYGIELNMELHILHKILNCRTVSCFHNVFTRSNL